MAKYMNPSITRFSDHVAEPNMTRWAKRGPGKTTADLQAEGNVGQGRMDYQSRVNDRKNNVLMRRRAKYMARSNRMGRRPRKYRDDSAMRLMFGLGLT